MIDRNYGDLLGLYKDDINVDNKIEILKKAFDVVSILESKTPEQVFWLKQYAVLIKQLKHPKSKGTKAQFDIVVDRLLKEYQLIG
ncbi:MAG: hypothetical protein ACJAUP_003747 [Cellvibrionaceae bacterium]|jgi:hypothetical protein